ncbi:MAG TPA: hypothetical protein VG889_07005 [Rhizomicrobium sp.]|nr:hypothetical protein [Rhizomicrobium sp.]
MDRNVLRPLGESSMDQNNFFRWVWRFNALALAGGGLFILGMAAISLLSAPIFQAPPEGHFTPVPNGAEKDHTYRLSPLQLSVGGEVLFQLGRWDGAPNKYGLADITVRSPSEYGGPNTVNLLAVDGATGAGHHLFRGYDREIVSWNAVTRPGDKPDSVPVPGQPIASGPAAIALVIRTIDADTDKDGALTAKDKQSLYVYRPGDGLATKLIDVDYLLSSDRTDGAHYLVVHERGKTAYAASYSLPDFKLLSEKPVPPL